MKYKNCKWCKILKEEKKFSQYKTTKGTILRKSTCNTCYNTKYRKWIKKPLFQSPHDNRFSWDKSTKEEKLIRMELIFKNHVIKKNGCWDWRGSIHHSGYPVVKRNKKQIRAHRFSWMLAYKQLEIRDNKWILHKCDNRKCTNPDHLYAGTPTQNALDREARNPGTKLLGSFHPNAVLNEEKVKKIKYLLSLKVPVIEIAKKFHCSSGAIGAIKENKTWKHVNI